MLRAIRKFVRRYLRTSTQKLLSLADDIRAIHERVYPRFSLRPSESGDRLELLAAAGLPREHTVAKIALDNNNLEASIEPEFQFDKQGISNDVRILLESRGYIVHYGQGARKHNKGFKR